jgi:5-methylcytosine-specific restriction endonuclease McrA
MEAAMDTRDSERSTRREPVLSASVLVLNRNYAAIRVISARRAFALIYRSCAQVVDARGETFDVLDFQQWTERSREASAAPEPDDAFVQTPRQLILVPRVIRLVSYDRVPRREVRFSRRNVLARDDHRCQYCGRRLPPSQLSIDHVTPKSRGGPSTWTNVVAACTPCNTRKGGRLPAEASMRLRTTPAIPKRNPLLAEKVRLAAYRAWRHFLTESDLAIDA